MISIHEAEVEFRFDELHGRFKRAIARDDHRLRGIVEELGSISGMRLLDLGCGKGRFSRALEARGAHVVGVDLSSAMLAEAAGLDRVRATARRLPFRDETFDGVVCIEVFEHLDPRSLEGVCKEVRRVLRPGGVLLIVDKNLGSLNARRPWLPNLALKRIDEYRGLWMYPRNGPVRERWFWPRRLRRDLRRWFEDVRVIHLMSSDEEKVSVFRRLPGTRLMTLWAARAPGGPHV